MRLQRLPVIGGINPVPLPYPPKFLLHLITVPLNPYERNGGVVFQLPDHRSLEQDTSGGYKRIPHPESPSPMGNLEPAGGVVRHQTPGQAQSSRSPEVRGEYPCTPGSPG
jgi:hypothetical protein